MPTAFSPAALSLTATLVTLKREDLVNPDAVPMPA
jgi:hypothetical protein